jgi:hypothetical protein
MGAGDGFDWSAGRPLQAVTSKTIDSDKHRERPCVEMSIDSSE